MCVRNLKMGSEGAMGMGVCWEKAIELAREKERESLIERDRRQLHVHVQITCGSRYRPDGHGSSLVATA
jgi:hypothetical protein